MKTCSDRYPTDPKKNVPRNISMSEANTCEQKCWLWYNYRGTSSCYMTNEGYRLGIRYDGGGDVTFNSLTYEPEKVFVFTPSIHQFNSTQTAAEIIIQHKSKTASDDGLLVCIPVLTTGSPSKASEILETIISQVPVEQGTTASPTVSDFTLNNFLPKAPYYTYTGPLPYGDCLPASKYNYVVFDPASNGSVTVKKSSIDQLRKAIHYSYIVANKGTVFYNKKGTNSNAFNGDGQIYIQCQPTGSSDEEVVYKEDAEGGPASAGKRDGTDLRFLWYILMIVAGIIIMVILFKVVKYVASMLDEASS